MPMKIPIGVDDFRKLREQGLEYVDKSHLISELIDQEGATVILLPRPRRFGKTLNLSMLRYFFEQRDENLWHLFEGLSIEHAGERYKKHFASYPVISISLKGVKTDNAETCQTGIRTALRTLYSERAWLLEHPALSEWDKQRMRAMLEGQANETEYRNALLFLCQCLHKAHKKDVIVLMDEYDAPIHAAFVEGFYRPVIDFFRDFFELTFKGNPYLHKGVITGILRVAKESVFSGLNNLAVYSLLSKPFCSCFGFTESEVQALLAKAGALPLLESVRAYYNGYRFGDREIYNPWSVLNFLCDEQKRLIPHWLGTSSNDLVKEMLQTHAFSVKEDLETLLAGGTIDKKIDENVSLSDLKGDARALWGLLVLTGYLKAWYEGVEAGKPPPPAKLAIPNGEIFEIYRSTFEAFVDNALRPGGSSLDALLKALLLGNAEQVQMHLAHYAKHLLSYHDTAQLDFQPERFYHGLLLGLLASLEPAYQVRSNRESGEGRPDISITPREAGKPGVVIELKIVPPVKSKAKHKQPAVVDKLLKAALAQAQEKAYGAEMLSAGASVVRTLAVVFDGKQVWVRAQT